MNLTTVTEMQKGRRHRCPFCNSSDGLSISDDGQKGVFHCFACEKGGDGIELLREMGYSFAAACQALGYSPPNGIVGIVADIRRHERLERVRREQEARESLIRLARIKQAMTEEERAEWLDAGKLPDRVAAKSQCQEIEDRVSRRL